MSLALSSSGEVRVLPEYSQHSVAFLSNSVVRLLFCHWGMSEESGMMCMISNAADAQWSLAGLGPGAHSPAELQGRLA